MVLLDLTFFNKDLQWLILSGTQDVAFSFLLIGPIISNFQYLFMTVNFLILIILIYLFQKLFLLLLFYFFSNIDFHLIKLLQILKAFSPILVIIMFLNCLLLFLFISFHFWSLYLVLFIWVKPKDSLFVIKLLFFLLNVDYHNSVNHFRISLFESFLIAGRNKQCLFSQLHFFRYDLILDSFNLCSQDNFLFLNHPQSFIVNLNFKEILDLRIHYLSIYLFNFEKLAACQVIIHLNHY
jgi:hypothetical protein